MVMGTSVARDRLLEVASQLFYSEGIHGIGVDRILATAGVTRATMYRHFRGKEDLVVAYLSREDDVIRGYFEDAKARAASPEDMIQAVLDGIAEDIARYHTRGCPFINAAAEYSDPDSDVRRVVAGHRDWFRQTLTGLLESANIDEPERVAGTLVLLRDAALVGSYLDGADVVTPVFQVAARVATGRA
jgi:AcrR family transcriptional regulator